MLQADPLQFYVFLAFSAVLTAALIPATVFVTRRTTRLRGGERHWEHSLFLVACLGYLASESLEILAPRVQHHLLLRGAAICYRRVPHLVFLFPWSTGSGPPSPAGSSRSCAVPALASDGRDELLPPAQLGRVGFIRTGPFIVFHAVKYGPGSGSSGATCRRSGLGNVLVFLTISRRARP
jgi:hypothetical protein